MASRRTSLLGAWALSALVFVCAPAACILAPEEVKGPCVQDSDCPDDGIPCTKEACDTATGFCARKPQDLPFGDPGCDDDNPCTDDLCSDGACAHEPAANPPLDDNECTEDKCVNGAESHTPVPDGQGCGNGLTCQSGKCKCSTADECGTSTACLTVACVDSACQQTYLPAGTKVGDDQPGDCLQDVCDGANNVVSAPDATDVPEDTVTGNCLKKGCDDTGVIDVPDPDDTPPDDGNPCRDTTCDNGNVITTDADGVLCGSAAKCAAVAGAGFQTTPHEVCAGGSCTTPAAISCLSYTCNAAGDACETACTGDGQCVAGTYCDLPSFTCKNLQGVGQPCQNQGQCAANTFCVDGYCCGTACTDLCQHCNVPNQEGLCSSISAGQDPDGECAGADACNGLGGCAKANGGSCNGPNDCLSGFCADGVCCNASCSGACDACNLPNKVGVCSPVAANSQPPGCDQQQACDANGVCKGQQGHACQSNGDCLNGICQDGVCCNSTCAGDCARCDVAGSVGTCTNVPQGQQVTNCLGQNACDGNNVCKKANGVNCGGASECASGFCPQENQARVCCNEACTDNCKSCIGSRTVNGMSGTCGFVKNNTDPNSDCSGQCNGGGNGCCNDMGMCQ